MKSLRLYFQRTIQEIQDDPVLRIYGGLLASLHILSVLYWFRSGLIDYLSKDVEAICWPAWENCQAWRFLGPDETQWAIILFGLVAFSNIALFAFKRTTRHAYFLLVVVNVMKLLILTVDFRLRMNHHIMTFWVSSAFLFFPFKRKTIQTLVLWYYFWAGTLKFNSEWISGSAIYDKIWIFQDPFWLRAACIYVVILEIVLIWGLWLHNKWIRWPLFIQLLLFHLFSFRVVGFYYPLLMYAVIAIYPLCWLFPAEEHKTNIFAFLFSKESRWAHALVIAFSLTQLQPKLLPGDSAITGEGRSFALHMFDSWTRCQVAAQINNNDGTFRGADLRTKLPIRLACDPIVYLSKARGLCRSERQTNPKFKDLDWSLQTRRSNQENFQIVVNLKDFCSKNIEYSFWGSNDWILK